MRMLLGDADAPGHAPHAPGDLRWDLHKFTQVHVTKLKAVINKILSLSMDPSHPSHRTEHVLFGEIIFGLRVCVCCHELTTMFSLEK